MQHLFTLAEDEIRVLRVDVEHNGGYLGVLLKQGGSELLLHREISARTHEHDHHLAARKAALHQHMAQEARALILVIDPNVEFRQHIADIDYYAVGNGILGHAVVHRDDAVGAGLIDPRDYLAAFSPAERRLHLVAVVIRLVHADYLIDLAKFL